MEIDKEGGSLVYMSCHRLTFIINMADIADQKNLIFHARAECTDCSHFVLG